MNGAWIHRKGTGEFENAGKFQLNLGDDRDDGGTGGEKVHQRRHFIYIYIYTNASRTCPQGSNFTTLA